MSYDSNETSLILDGLLVAKGTGVVSVPSSAAGLVIGITVLGTSATEGEFDEICTFARPLGENEQALLRPREPLGPCSRRTPLVISEIM